MSSPAEIANASPVPEGRCGQFVAYTFNAAREQHLGGDPEPSLRRAFRLLDLNPHAAEILAALLSEDDPSDLRRAAEAYCTSGIANVSRSTEVTCSTFAAYWWARLHAEASGLDVAMLDGVLEGFLPAPEWYADEIAEIRSQPNRYASEVRARQLCEGGAFGQIGL